MSPVNQHDPLCPSPPHAVGVGWLACQCDLIAKVRADEAARLDALAAGGLISHNDGLIALSPGADVHGLGWSPISTELLLRFVEAFNANVLLRDLVKKHVLDAAVREDHPHNHVTRDIKPLGQCPRCDLDHNSGLEKELGIND